MGGLLKRLAAVPPAGAPAGHAGGTPTLDDLLRALQPRLLDEYGHLVNEARRDRSRREKLRSVVLQVLVRDNVGHARLSREALADELTSAMVGYGPLEPLMADPDVTEVMVNGPGQVYVERRGRIEPTTVTFRDEDDLMHLIARMVAPLGRRVDVSSPYADARLPDGSRINVIIPPLSLEGPVLTVRKFPGRPLCLNDLVGLGTMNEEMAELLSLCFRGRLNVLISGGAGSGKTTTLGALVGSLPTAERIITIEDSAELRIQLPHVVRLECRPPNAEGKGEVTMRQLLRNALRMRPDRIVVGECRGGEALDMLQAMNTGHPGSACTVHANSSAEALTRLENMVLMADANLPLSAIRLQIRTALDVIVHQARFRDGRRRVVEVSLVRKEGALLCPVFRHAIDEGGVERFERVAGVALESAQAERLIREGLTVPAWVAGE
ncbi:MAG: CpaF family protein [Bacillota bacterium]|nr:CpaF family protein [Bacillota bacterium]MDI7248753.1 CpaF family protein [Bacillota bacterium]